MGDTPPPPYNALYVSKLQDYVGLLFQEGLLFQNNHYNTKNEKTHMLTQITYFSDSIKLCCATFFFFFCFVL